MRRDTIFGSMPSNPMIIIFFSVPPSPAWDGTPPSPHPADISKRVINAERKIEFLKMDSGFCFILQPSCRFI
jgi:hypothetical protein